MADWRTMTFMLPSQNSAALSLADVLPSCLHSLGAKKFPNALKLKEVSSAVIVVVDGLGTHNLGNAKAHARFLSEHLAHSSTIHTVFPSTTSAALSTLATGVLPGSHGITGYKVQDPLTKKVFNQLKEISQVSTTPWLITTPLWAEVDSYIIGIPRFGESGLTEMIYEGSKYVAATSIEERFQKALEISGQLGTLCLVYISELDEIAHKNGVASHAWAQALEDVDSEFKKFTQEITPQIGVLLVADHGVVDVPPHKHVLLGAAEEFSHCSNIGGEPRCLQLYLAEGVQCDKEAERLSSLGISHVSFFTKDEVINSGLFGEVDEGVIDRLGDIFAFAHDGYAIYDIRDTKLTGRQMIGQHGGTSPIEQEIPCGLFGGFRN